MADAKQEVSNGSSQSRLILAKPRLGGFGSSSFGASSSGKSNPFGSVLRPPQLKPANNPFLKTSEDTPPDDKEEVNEAPKVEEAQERLKEDGETPKFVPLGSTNATPRTSNPSQAPVQPPASGSGFVFGQNLSDRVVMTENVNNGDADSAEHAETNGTSETTDLLFTNAAANVKDNQEEAPSNDNNATSEDLASAAAEYERSHARQLPATSNCTMTGEEEEINVLQISCRLFAWETGSWRERGRGVLRLNDSPDATSSRLVARVAGSLRVVLNTKLWPEMVVERAGNKSLRVTAADAQQQIKLYLIMGAPGDILQLNRALLSRIAGSKKTTTCKQNETSQQAAERLDNEFDEKLTVENEQRQPEEAKEVTDRIETMDSSEKNETERELNSSNEDSDGKQLKRKDPIKDETSPKRQCTDVVVTK